MRMGRKKIPFYRIVAVDSRKKRDGAYIEKLGYYNPLTQPATVTIKADRVKHWLDEGAQATDTVRSLLKKEGLLQRWALENVNIPDEIKDIEIQKRDEAQAKRDNREIEVAIKKKAAAVTEPTIEEEQPTEESVGETTEDVVEESAATVPVVENVDANEETPKESEESQEKK